MCECCGPHPQKELKASLNTRLVGYKDLRRRIAERACLYFANFVRRRGYNGALHIDMEKKKLEIIVSLLEKRGREREEGGYYSEALGFFNSERTSA